MRLYLARAGRSLAPVFLAGESYGGFRVALLAKRLLRAGFDVRGAVLISPVIEFSLVHGDSLMLLPDALALPLIALAHLEMTKGRHQKWARYPPLELLCGLTAPKVRIGCD